MTENRIIIRQLGLQPYEKVSKAMYQFTNQRNTNSNDEIWMVQHPKVFTQGQSSKNKHIMKIGSIPVIQSNRGGQITFHGPGQQLMYILINLRRYHLKVSDLIYIMEKTVIATLAHFFIFAHTINEAPGVYVNNDKICSLALRIIKGCSLHGLALNVSMDLSPFLCINPCGYTNLRMTQVSILSPNTTIDDIVPILIMECFKLLDVNISICKIQKWNPLFYY